MRDTNIYIRIADFASGANDKISAFYIYHQLDKCVVHRKSARGEGHVPYLLTKRYMWWLLCSDPC